MEFEGWERKYAQEFYKEVSNDLKPPELHLMENPRPITDEDQVEAFARRRAAMQSPSSSPSYEAIAKSFGINLAESVAAPLIFAKSVLEDPNKAIFYSQMARNAVRHPIDTAIAIDRGLRQGIEQGVDTLVNGDNVSRAALAGSLVGGMGIPFFSKIPGTISSLRGIEFSGGMQTFGARGTISGRLFDETYSGGPLRDLTGSQSKIKFTNKGIDVVEEHLSRFGPDSANNYMINRLRSIAKGEISPTDIDRNFYSHELREFVRYRRLGWKTGVPENLEERNILWNNAHTATLEEYGLSGIESELYHPEAIELVNQDMMQFILNLNLMK